MFHKLTKTSFHSYNIDILDPQVLKGATIF